MRQVSSVRVSSVSLGVLLVVGAMSVGCNAQAATVIDDFSTGFALSVPNFAVDLGAGSRTTTQGNRTAILTTFGGNNRPVGAGILASSSPFLYFDQGSSTGSPAVGRSRLELSYSFTDLDLTAGGATAFLFDVNGTDAGPGNGVIPLSVWVSDGANFGEAFLAGGIGNVGLFSIAFAGLSGVDLTSIDTVRFTIGGETNWGADVSFVNGLRTNGTPVPLPAAAWLLIGGLGMLGVVRRRRAD